MVLYMPRICTEPFWGYSAIGAVLGPQTYCFFILLPREMRFRSCDSLYFLGYALNAATVAVLASATMDDHGTLIFCISWKPFLIGPYVSMSCPVRPCHSTETLAKWDDLALPALSSLFIGLLDRDNHCSEPATTIIVLLHDLLFTACWIASWNCNF